jgi:hypothetical protein
MPSSAHPSTSAMVVFGKLGKQIVFVCASPPDIEEKTYTPTD